MADIEKERAGFQSWLESDDSPLTTRMHKSYGPDYVEQAEREAAWEGWAKRATIPSADAAEMKRLADALEAQSQGIEEWRVADPKTGAYCMHFALDVCIDPERSAREWLRKHIEEFPRGRFIGHEVRRVIVQTEAQETATAAAALLRRMAGEDA